MKETGNVADNGSVAAAKVIGRSKLTHTPPKTTVVFFESVDDFADYEENDGRRPSICNKNLYPEGALRLVSEIGLSGIVPSILALRLLRGIAEMPCDPYFWIRDLLSISEHDEVMQKEYESFRLNIKKMKFRSNGNTSLFELFEMPSFTELVRESQSKKQAA